MIKPETEPGNKPHSATIHMAEPADAPAIAALAQELAAFENHATACDRHAIEELLEAGRHPVCHLFVAKKESISVGFAICYPGYDLTSHSYGMHLADICVATMHRRQGIGRQMISAIAELAAKNEGEWVSLTVQDRNRAGQAFYEQLGFVDTKSGLYATGKRGIIAIIKSSLS